jgi:hypothetical protein
MIIFLDINSASPTVLWPLALKLRSHPLIPYSSSPPLGEDEIRTDVDSWDLPRTPRTPRTPQTPQTPRTPPAGKNPFQYECSRGISFCKGGIQDQADDECRAPIVTPRPLNALWLAPSTVTPQLEVAVHRASTFEKCAT